MFVDSNSLEIKRKALLGIDLLCYVVKAADKEMLEDRLETRTPWNPRKNRT